MLTGQHGTVENSPGGQDAPDVEDAEGGSAELRRITAFDRWFQVQRTVGNSPQHPRLIFSWPAGEGVDQPYLSVMEVAVRVAAEDRVKSTELVVTRPDYSAVALYRRAATLDETQVVLVREFRTPGSTADAFVHELPGGSGSEPDALAQAVTELAEETGLHIEPSRLRAHGSRQSAATLSAHHVHLFSAEISEDELAWLRAQRDKPKSGGGDERTWVEIATFGEIRRGGLVDWTTLGMIAQCLLRAED